MRFVGELRRLLFVVAGAVACVGFQGCYTRPTNFDLVAIDPAPAGTNDPFTVMVATNREPGSEAEPFFTRNRSPETSYAKFAISVPASGSRETGKFETPRNPRKAKPEKHYYSTSSKILENEAAFAEQLKQQVAANTKSKTVAIYVHGVFTRFPEGVFYAAQLNHDSGFAGTSVLFAWPTGGGWLDYVYDKDSATSSRDALERTIKIAADSGADEIMIVAHSMGCLLTMETLRQASIAENPTFDGKLTCVILASADIAVDVFVSQFERMGLPPLNPRIGVLVSHDDRLLKLATFVARGGVRVGRDDDHAKLNDLGVDVFDITEYTSKGVSNHYKFAATPKSLIGIYGIMQKNLEAGTPANYYPIDRDGNVIDTSDRPEPTLSILKILDGPLRFFGSGFGIWSN